MLITRLLLQVDLTILPVLTGLFFFIGLERWVCLHEIGR
jgi:hypothetical protein